MGPRKALMRGLANNLITNEKMVTTEAKAKALRPHIEKMVTKSRVSKEDSLAVRRDLLSALDHEVNVAKLIDEIAPRFVKRPGGYTRIIKLPVRQGDGAKMAQIEFIEGDKVTKKAPVENKEQKPKAEARPKVKAEAVTK